MLKGILSSALSFLKALINLQNPDMHLTTETQAQSCFICQFHPIWNNSATSSVYLEGTGVHVALFSLVFYALPSAQPRRAGPSRVLPFEPVINHTIQWFCYEAQYLKFLVMKTHPEMHIQTMKHRTERHQMAWGNKTESILSSSICFQTRSRNRR